MRVGSKQFTEGVILGEIVTEVGLAAGARAEHRAQLGGTRILWTALVGGEIDAYVEYTGTIALEILPDAHLPRGDLAALRAALHARGLGVIGPLGFQNTYALGMREDRAAALGIRTISDLAGHPDLVLGLSSEFLDREDGWPGLAARYALPHGDVRGLVHDLAYRALDAGQIDVTDLYTTDAEIARYHLRVLDDDRGYFPDYDAILVYREAWAAGAPAVVAALQRLVGAISPADMIAMNAAARLDGVPEIEVAGGFVRDHLGLTARRHSPGLAARLWARTREHLWLVGLSLVLAIAAALPLGIAAARHRVLGQVVLAAVGVLQTVPSLALLVLMIPLLGIGGAPAVAAMFAYSLLPIVRTTHAGLTGIAPGLLESADVLGLSRRARLWRVELPLASPAILAGIKTAAVLSVGTATIGALVGAGGYGQTILTGIRLDDTRLIMEGALPAAALAIAVQALFEGIERLVVPRGLRLRPEA
ncbi:MAG: ABC transporter permease subunit [Kofleriaceae bacterium]|nr:ABC transporter permease subunit [Myxococcales bacterium]MCB9561833.1 ABC transporter permease subunit [Kofleriaceae bacterium]MCB9574097.1 ABC transporter permease subunit [Kofleriaceae bacterium]